MDLRQAVQYILGVGRSVVFNFFSNFSSNLFAFDERSFFICFSHTFLGSFLSFLYVCWSFSMFNILSSYSVQSITTVLLPLSAFRIKKLKTTDVPTPRIYGLPKIHKNNNSLREIVSFCGYTTYQLSKYLSPILSPLVGKTEYHIRNTYEWVNKAKLGYPQGRKCCHSASCNHRMYYNSKMLSIK